MSQAADVGAQRVIEWSNKFATMLKSWVDDLLIENGKLRNELWECRAELHREKEAVAHFRGKSR